MEALLMGVSVFMKKPRYLIEEGSDSWTYFLQLKDWARVTAEHNRKQIHSPRSSVNGLAQLRPDSGEPVT